MTGKAGDVEKVDGGRVAPHDALGVPSSASDGEAQADERDDKSVARE